MVYVSIWAQVCKGQKRVLCILCYHIHLIPLSWDFFLESGTRLAASPSDSPVFPLQCRDYRYTLILLHVIGQIHTYTFTRGVGNLITDTYACILSVSIHCTITAAPCNFL